MTYLKISTLTVNDLVSMVIPQIYQDLQKFIEICTAIRNCPVHLLYYMTV